MRINNPFNRWHKTEKKPPPESGPFIGYLGGCHPERSVHVMWRVSGFEEDYQSLHGVPMPEPVYWHKVPGYAYLGLMKKMDRISELFKLLIE